MPTAYSGNVDGNAWLAGPLSDARQDVFLMSPAMFGSGDSASPSNTPAPFDGPRFPRVSLRDNIRAQRKLLEHLCPGITEIKVVGWSMGAAQCYHWAAMEPELVKAIVPLCGSAKTSPHNHTFLEGIKLSLLADVDFCDGDYVKHGKFPEAGIKAFGTTYCSYGTSQVRHRTRMSLGHS
jgi:homoserine O-acetyltransferase